MTVLRHMARKGWRFRSPARTRCTRHGPSISWVGFPRTRVTSIVRGACMKSQFNRSVRRKTVTSRPCSSIISETSSPLSAILLQTQEHYESALTIWQQRQDTWGIGIALLNLGNVALQGDVPRAGELFGVGLATCAGVGDQAAIADYVDAVGRLAAARAQWQPAARLLSAAAALYATVGIKQFPGHRAEHERALAAAQTGLGEGAFAAARQEGEHLTPEEAVDKALAVAAKAVAREDR